MNGCANCFAHDGPIPLTADAASLGDCDFCGCKGADVWDVVVWADHFARVLDMYEEGGDEDVDAPLHCSLQRDWGIFTFDDPDTVFRFLQSTFGEGGHPVLESRSPVRPRFEQDGAGADHKSRWDEFRRELIHENRYFPAADFDLDFLRGLIRSNQRQLSKGMQLYRARVCPSPQPYPPEQMGVAPSHLVAGGRGNPVGIPHLYLAGDLETCLKECRAVFNGFVSVAVFEVCDQVPYLDLASLRPANPFLVPDTDEGNALVSSLVATQFLAELGRELSVPTRPGENQIEYVPTQYLCELVKSLGFAGIRYNSSLHAGGWNIVLFHEQDAQIVPPVQSYEVIDFSFGYDRRN